MTSPPFTLEIEAELRRLEAAARGPRWLVPEDDTPCFGGHETDDYDAWTCPALSWDDAALIAAMRNAIVPLLDALDRWRTHFNQQAAQWAATNVALREERDALRAAIAAAPRKEDAT